MNIIIYTLVILTIFYLLVKKFTTISSKKISKSARILLIIGLFLLAILFAVGGKYLLTLPLTLASLALLKLKGLSIFQLISLYRLINTLRNSGRFSFNNKFKNNQSNITIDEAYRILNLDPQKKYTKEEVLNSYKAIMKKIHPDVSPELSRLATIVNEAKDIVLNNFS
ncbi:J domain-containing protein [Candidatus Pelagibacter sp.]|uniref:J domain-containing protein n=1 Tax=Candidatus Pelagibacter sp. TaxID=2024849 RepID=UPI003F8755BA